jgi:D-alanyl-lipoteichoic acid acyltransferase DltB (MBOAT superfamily)
LPRVAAWAVTFLFVDLTWVVFRSPDLHVLSKVFGAMFGAFPAVVWNALQSLPALPPGQWLSTPTGVGEAALLVAIILAFAPSYSYRLAARMKPNLWTASLAAVFLTLAVLRFSSVSYFLYYFF